MPDRTQRQIEREQPEERQTQGYFRALHSLHKDEREAAMTCLAAMGEPVVHQLCILLESETGDARPCAARVLSRIAEASACPGLRRALPRLRSEARKLRLRLAFNRPLIGVESPFFTEQELRNTRLALDHYLSAIRKIEAATGAHAALPLPATGNTPSAADLPVAGDAPNATDSR